MKRFRGGLVSKAHRRLHHSTLGSRVTRKKKKKYQRERAAARAAPGLDGLEAVAVGRVLDAKMAIRQHLVGGEEVGLSVVFRGRGWVKCSGS